MLIFQLYGPFSMTDEAGIDRRPKLMKARAILAVLAATKGHRHSRSWFIAMLWPDRQHLQALSSMRSALSDIRRHLGPYADALITDNTEVALDPACFKVEENGSSNGHLGEFLEGFDVGHADGFEDWLVTQRMAEVDEPPKAAPRADFGLPAQPYPAKSTARIFLASRSHPGDHFTAMQCDALVDCLAKSIEEIGLADIIDGRGCGDGLDDFRAQAARDNCGLMLVAEAAEASGQAIARLKIVETDRGVLVWSKSLTGRPMIDLEDPLTISVVAGVVDHLSERFLRGYRGLEESNMPPQALALSGINRLFRLGLQNYQTADVLLKQAHALDHRGRYLAWRAFLRTFMLCEQQLENPEAVVEEATALARRALEAEPYNSMVLALCAHVETMLHSAYECAYDMSSRALELNACNPLAWASLGAAASFLGETQKGHGIAKVGARIGKQSCFSFQAESWASATGLLAGDIGGALKHAERSHMIAPSFAPPMRYLSALYCIDGQFGQAAIVAEKLRSQEPDFTMNSLKQDGYPADSLRRSGLLKHIPAREI